MAAEREDDLFENGKGRAGTSGGLSDMMKKALFATIGAVFMTEESVRGYVAESKLPREIRNYIIQNTAQAKEQFFGYLAKELSQLVLKSDLPKALEGFLRDHTIELDARVRFRANGAPELAGGMRAVPAANGAASAPAAAGASAQAQAQAPPQAPSAPGAPPAPAGSSPATSLAPPTDVPPA